MLNNHCAEVICIWTTALNVNKIHEISFCFICIYFFKFTKEF